MQLKRTYIFVLGLILLSSFAVVQHNETTNPIALITTQTNFEVGNTVVLKFTASEDEKPLLYCSNSYGSTLISGELKDDFIQYKIPEKFTYDIQWSMSYFTHLTPISCDQVLNLIQKKGNNNSLQFNSWLIFDDESKFALEAQMANRLLPYDMGVYLTRSKENPLTATCYKEKFINEI